MQAQTIEFLELLNGQLQYVVPRWQRRYCWGQSDIERLVEDLLTIADADSNATHYGGTLLTFPEPDPAGVVKTHRVVDGQQRLTTVSVLLACIAAELGPDGACDGWTKQFIFDDRLTNPGKPLEKSRKLRLQDGDEEEYRLGLEGKPAGAGAVTQAWKITRRLVAKNDIARLLRGLNRLQVVSIGLGNNEDPQQIFESLNATGRPLTESEKVKNWLLMGLPDAKQQELHDNHWLRIESLLGARHSTQPADIFLRDMLRWRTGQTHGIDHVYEEFRRWAVRSENMDRQTLCRDLARLAGLYGMLTGTAQSHDNTKVERELRHLREIGIDVHRPLTLRLLNDADENDCGGSGDAALPKILAGIGAWTTRMWLADRPTPGMNKAIAELAHERGPDASDDFAEHWLGRIRRLRNTRVAVPGDEDVRKGIRTRKAYGGSATKSTRAILCELMEADHREEAPARDHLTVEHVMPQRLTDAWKRDLGDDAEEIHGEYRDRLANLTLSGDVTNAGMGANTFAAKRDVYRKSSIGMTRSLANESEWNEAALQRRADDLARQALERWPWADQTAPQREAPLHWRLGNGPWRAESTASQMVQNVAAALLSRDPANGQKLAGEAIHSNVHSADRYPPEAQSAQRMRPVPGHPAYVIYPYARDIPTSAKRCRNMGQRCGVEVEVNVELKDNTRRSFWKFLKENTGGVPGQTETWRGPTQWSTRDNGPGDRVGIYVGNEELLWLYIRSGETHPSRERAARMRRYSWMIRNLMGDQRLAKDLDSQSEKGMTIEVQRAWVHDDQDGWTDAAQWICEQCERLHAILADANGGES